jgi:ribonuclease HI
LLWLLATRSEKLASKRVAKSKQITCDAALRMILQEKYPGLDLQELLADRQKQAAAVDADRTHKRQTSRQAYQDKLRAKYQAAGVWCAWFDGSAHPNPGRCGIGALLQSPEGKRWQLSRFVGYGNSSVAEYQALILALEMALQQGAGHLIVFGDSRVVIDDVQATGQACASSLSDWRLRSRDLLRCIPDVKLRWLPRERNHEADALSQAALIDVSHSDEVLYSEPPATS